MNGNPQPYPDYRPSGLSWLRDVPAHWDVRRMRSILKPVNERNHPNLPLLSVVREKGVILRDLDDTDENHNVIPEDLSNYKVVRSGQFAINKMKAWQGSYGVSDHQGIVSPAYFVFDVNDINPQFLHRATRSRAYIPSFNRASDGVRIGQWDLSPQRLREIPIAVPPPDEQAAIVRYLDHADDLINRYISAKEQLIALLEEQRQAVIHQVVTTGLDPNVPVRPPGSPGLSNIPRHWTVRKLGHLATKFGSGITPRGGAAVYREEGVPFLRSQNVHFEGLRLQGVAKIPLALHQQLSGSHVQPDDVLLNITGASIGRVCSVPTDIGEANVNQHVCIIRPNQRHLLPRFLSAYLSTPHMQDEIRTEQTGASREGLTIQSIRDFLLPVPPVGEQHAIIAFIVEATDLIDQAVSTSQNQILLMKEYRTRLIADVVTGKLDVRDAAVAIPTRHL